MSPGNEFGRSTTTHRPNHRLDSRLKNEKKVFIRTNRSNEMSLQSSQTLNRKTLIENKMQFTFDSRVMQSEDNGFERDFAFVLVSHCLVCV